VTVLYLNVRYIGILYSANEILANLPTVLLTDMGCTITAQVQTWASFVVNAILCVIMIIRLHVMYQRSRKMLIFLIAIFLALTIASGVILVVMTSHASAEEFILSGIHLCLSVGYSSPLSAETWILGTVWEILALCLAAWVAVRHFRELRRHSTGQAIEDYLTVLIRSHIFYFAGFAIAASLCLGNGMSPTLSNSSPFLGVLQIATTVQIFVLGPRLILSVRQYHAELVNPVAGTIMTTIAFQERVHVSTGSDL